MDPGRMSFNDYRSYLKEHNEKVTSGEASIRWRDAQAAAGIEYVSPSKKRRERSARVKAARSDELKNNAELAGRVAATRWENMTDEQKNEVKARLDNDVAFADAFVEAIGSVMTLDRSSSDLFDEETGEESKGDAGEESKEEGGEEAKENTEKSDLRRTAPMDDEERKQALRSILGNYADRDSLVDDMGLPLGKERREHRSSPCRGIWQQTDESQGCEGSQGEGNHFGCGQAGRRSTSSPHEASPRTLIRR